MKRFLKVLPLLLLVTGLPACMSLDGTRVESVSSQPPEAATMKKVLVLGVNTTPEVQHAMEAALSKRLSGPDRVVVLASDWFPGEKQPAREQLAARVKAEGVTGVLVTRLLDYEVKPVQEKERDITLFTPPRTPGARVGWEQDPWVAGSADPHQHDSTALVESRAIVETRLYDTATGDVVWEARSKTLLERDAAKSFDGFVSAILAQLKKSGWL